MFYLIPLVLLVILYITIYRKLKAQNIPGEQSANAGQQRQQREQNVLKTAIAIVLESVHGSANSIFQFSWKMELAILPN